VNAQLTLLNCTLSGNSAFTGGGIWSAGPVTLIDSTLSGNCPFSSAPFCLAAVEAVAEDDLGCLERAQVATRAVRPLDAALVAREPDSGRGKRKRGRRSCPFETKNSSAPFFCDVRWDCTGRLPGICGASQNDGGFTFAPLPS